MDVRYDDRRGMSWGWLIGLALVVWVCAMYLGFGPQATRQAPPYGTPCATKVASNQVSGWIDRLGGWADYDGGSGYWRDAAGNVVGWSITEDSDVCSYVR